MLYKFNVKTKQFLNKNFFSPIEKNIIQVGAVAAGLGFLLAEFFFLPAVPRLLLALIMLLMLLLTRPCI